MGSKQCKWRKAGGGASLTRPQSEQGRLGAWGCSANTRTADDPPDIHPLIHPIKNRQMLNRDNECLSPFHIFDIQRKRKEKETGRNNVRAYNKRCWY